MIHGDLLWAASGKTYWRSGVALWIFSQDHWIHPLSGIAVALGATRVEEKTLSSAQINYRREFHGHCQVWVLLKAFQDTVLLWLLCMNPYNVLIWFSYAGSINNIDDTEYKCLDGTVPDVRNKVISGVVGASSSGTSIQVANLLRLFKIPQVRIDSGAQDFSWKWFSHFPHSRKVSFFSSSPELSNKQRFEYFTRTIPSDHHQVMAIVQMIRFLKWSYISILYEESTYGIKVIKLKLVIFLCAG